MSKDTNCNLCGADDYQVLFAADVAQINQIVQCNHKKKVGVWKLSVFRPERKNDSGEFIPP
jgi:hypothetical protein